MEEFKKGKQMFVVYHRDGDRLDYTESETELEAISKIVTCREAFESGRFVGFANDWQHLKDQGYRVEEFYKPEPEPETESEIDWEPVIIECMKQEGWGDFRNCSFCKVVGVKLRLDVSENCPRCLFAKYAREHGISFFSVACGAVAKKISNTNNVYDAFSPKNFPHVLHTLYHWYMAKKKEEE